MYIADYYNNRIRKVTASTGVISTFAGNDATSYIGDGSTATSANLYYPTAVAVDSAGNIYIADSINNRIRKLTISTGIITTIAGTGYCDYTGDGVDATTASLCETNDVLLDSAGRMQPYYKSRICYYLVVLFIGDIYIADSGNSAIRKVTVSTGIISTFAGTGNWGNSGDEGLAINAELGNPVGIALDSAGTH